MCICCLILDGSSLQYVVRKSRINVLRIKLICLCGALSAHCAHCASIHLFFTRQGIPHSEIAWFYDRCSSILYILPGLISVQGGLAFVHSFAVCAGPIGSRYATLAVLFGHWTCSEFRPYLDHGDLFREHMTHVLKHYFLNWRIPGVMLQSCVDNTFNRANRDAILGKSRWSPVRVLYSRITLSSRLQV